MTTFTIHNWGIHGEYLMSSIVVRPHRQIAAPPHPRRSFLGMCIQAEGECAKQQWWLSENDVLVTPDRKVKSEENGGKLCYSIFLGSTMAKNVWISLDFTLDKLRFYHQKC